MVPHASDSGHASGGQITWLHLSDLHACDANKGWDSKPVLDGLKDDLKLMAREQALHPDMILFTGDLAYGHLGDARGLSLDDQYAEVGDFLDDVRASFSPKIPKKRVFMVPGNHDVGWRAVGGSQNEYLDKSTRQADEIHDMMAGNTADWKRFMERLSSFRGFLRKRGYGHLLSRPDYLISGHKLKVGGCVVGIACLNSAWSCGEKRGKGQIWLGGHWQVGRLAAEVSDADIRIALLHHPSGWYVQQESGMWRRDIQNRFAFCLHGHEHDPVVEHIITPQHFRIAAGACHDRSDRLLSYNFVRLLPSVGRGEVWCRRYDNRGSGWGPDVVTNVTDPNGVVVLYDIIIPGKLQGGWSRKPYVPTHVEPSSTSTINSASVRASVDSARAEVAAAEMSDRVDDAVHRLNSFHQGIEELLKGGETEKAFDVAVRLRDWMGSHIGVLPRELTSQSYSLLAKAWGVKAQATAEAARKQTLVNEAHAFLWKAHNA